MSNRAQAERLGHLLTENLIMTGKDIPENTWLKIEWKVKLEPEHAGSEIKLMRESGNGWGVMFPTEMKG